MRQVRFNRFLYAIQCTNYNKLLLQNWALQNQFCNNESEINSERSKKLHNTIPIQCERWVRCKGAIASSIFDMLNSLASYDIFLHTKL